MGQETELAPRLGFHWTQPICVKPTLHGSELSRNHEHQQKKILHHVRRSLHMSRNTEFCGMHWRRSFVSGKVSTDTEKKRIIDDQISYFLVQTCILVNGLQMGYIMEG